MKKNKKMEIYRKRLKEYASRRTQFWKPEEGNNYIRILPPIKEEDDFYLESRVHFVPGAGEGGRMAATACLGAGCYLCKAVEKLQQRSNPDDDNLAQRLRPATQFLLNIVDLNDPDKGVQVWRHYSFSIIESLLGYMVDPEWGDFTDPVHGRNVNIRMTRRGSSPSYEVVLKPKESKIPSSWLSNRKDLSRLVPSVDKAENKRLANLVLGSREGDEDYEEARRVRRRKKKIKKVRF